MTTKILTGTYSAGYALQASTTVLTITASGYVGGSGVSSVSTANPSPAVYNYGHIKAGSGSHSTGIYLGQGGSVTNGASAVISGTVGVTIANGYGNVTNLGSISGGIALTDGGVVTNGSATDHGASISGQSSVSITGKNSHGEVINYGSIASGVALGGDKSTDVVLNYGSIGAGSGTSGVSIGYGGAVFNGSAGATGAQISGYVGIADTPTSGPGTGVFVVNGGTIRGSNAAHGIGVSLYNGQVINGAATDQTALISGFVGITNDSSQTSLSVNVGNYGTIQGLGSLGGVGILLNGSGSITNGSALDHAAQITGSMGVKLVSAGEVDNFGTITGTYGKAVQLYSAQARFAVEAYSVVHGVVLTAAGGLLELAAPTGTITNLGTSGVYAIATISGPESMKFIGFNTYQFDAGTNWTLAGTNIVGTGHTLTLAGGLNIAGTLLSTGSLVLNGSVSGAGTINIAGGAAAIGASLNFAGRLNESAGAVLQIATGTIFNVAGTSTLAGEVDGPGQLWLRAASVNGLVIGGGLTIQVGGAGTQTGAFTLGDANTGAVTLEILKAGSWNISGGSIVTGGSSGGRIVNFGLMTRSGGTGVSTVSAYLTNNGIFEAASGTTDCTNRLYGTGSLKIDAGATLETDNIVIKTLTANFNGANAVLAIGNVKVFAATIGGFATSDTIDLLNLKATGASVNGSNQLVVVSGSTTVATLQLTGAYTGAAFNAASDGRGGTNITLASAPSPLAMAAAMAAMAPGAGGGAMTTAQETASPLAPMLARSGG